VAERADVGKAISIRLKGTNLWHFDTLQHAIRNSRPLKPAPALIQLFYLQLVTKLVRSLAISVPQILLAKHLECAHSEQDSCC
jgi:hypothetical protein